MKIKKTIAAATTAAAALAIAAPAHATFPGENGEIAYTKGNDTSLYAISGLGSHLISETDIPGRGLGNPAYSPDGLTVAFDSCCGLGNAHTLFADAAGGGYRNPLNGGDPTFAPDGEHIARVLTAQGTQLVVSKLDGSDATPLGVYTDPDWSPDGTTIVATGGTAESNADIVAIPVDGGPPQPLTTSSSYENRPSWSPDGAQIAYTREGNAGPSAIIVMNADGSQKHKVADGVTPVWSPDGTMIAFNHSDADASLSGTWVMDADGSNQRLIIQGAYAQAWQPADTALPLPGDEPDPGPGPDPDPEPGPVEPPADNHKPVCRSVHPSIKRMPWRPTRKFVPVRFTGGGDPDGDAVEFKFTWVAQDEPVVGRGDRTAPDAVLGADPRTVLLRNERSPRGDGRVYYVEFSLTDEWGARCTASRTVRVRRHKRKPAVWTRFSANSLAVPGAK